MRAGIRVHGRTIVGVWVSRRFLGVRLGRRYWKLKDVREHPVLYTERHELAGYRRLVSVGHWILSVTR